MTVSRSQVKKAVFVHLCAVKSSLDAKGDLTAPPPHIDSPTESNILEAKLTSEKIKPVAFGPYNAVFI